MPNGVPLSDKEKQQIYTRYVMGGERQRDIAEDFGISVAAVSTAIKQQRKLGEAEVHEKVIAGDKRNGRLIAGKSSNRFEGTCVIGGKAHSKTFTAASGHAATEQWEKWCQGLRDEQAFMAMVERKPKAEEEPQVVCGAPLDPIEEIRPIQAIEPAPVPEIDVRPWKDVAEERQQRIEELEAKVAELEASGPLRSDWVIERTEYEKPILEHWFNNNGSFRVMWTSKPMYVIWAKTAVPKLYGAYQTMETALRELDKLNGIAAYLGETKFEVEEVAWRG